jgi:hypothetical protein
MRAFPSWLATEGVLDAKASAKRSLRAFQLGSTKGVSLAIVIIDKNNVTSGASFVKRRQVREINLLSATSLNSPLYSLVYLLAGRRRCASRALTTPGGQRNPGCRPARRPPERLQNDPPISGAVPSA